MHFVENRSIHTLLAQSHRQREECAWYTQSVLRYHTIEIHIHMYVKINVVSYFFELASECVCEIVSLCVSGCVCICIIII